MYTLRKINTNNGIETNICLGQRYDLITKEHNPEQYEKTSKEVYDGQVELIVYGFIVYNNGSNIEDLCCHYHNYIMTEGGKTFANLSLK